jgi:hypothetical protein
MLEIDWELIGELPALVQIRSLWSFKEEIHVPKVTALQRRKDRQHAEHGINADGINRRMRFVMSDDEFQVWVCMWE